MRAIGSWTFSGMLGRSIIGTRVDCLVPPFYPTHKEKTFHKSASPAKQANHKHFQLDRAPPWIEARRNTDAALYSSYLFTAGCQPHTPFTIIGQQAPTYKQPLNTAWDQKEFLFLDRAVLCRELQHAKNRCRSMCHGHKGTQ